jgi:hypothetical protein
MYGHSRPSSARVAAWAAAIAIFSACAYGDEIRLKDGKKLYGVIVAYEDNMFKVKTDYGFVLVEKDKIASIIPTAPATPAPKPEAAPTKTDAPAKNPVPAKTEPAKPDAAKATATTPAAPATRPPAASLVNTPSAPEQKPSAAAIASKDSKTAATTPSTASTSLPAKPPSVSATAPVPHNTAVSSAPPASKPANVPPATAVKSVAAMTTAKPITPSSATPKTQAPQNVPTVTAVAPAKPKPAAPPPNREALEGNMYVNYTHGFKMYKAPSWKLIEEARKSLPNAIVAMGTSNESTLLVIGEEKAKDNLEATATDVEGRLRETYGNYRRVSQTRTVASGYPAVQIRYHGIADDHDWSGTLLVVSRGGDTFSILGMTYSDTDLIQIQENVISRAIASLEFNSN